MIRKLIPFFSLILISFLGILFFFDINSNNGQNFEETFSLTAIYYEDQGFVKISFDDKSKKTSKVTLEILGMTETFQKSYNQSNFTEQVFFEGIPKYGWKIHPIVLDLDHEDLGKIGLKTEIHSITDPLPPVIFSKP